MRTIVAAVTASLALALSFTPVVAQDIGEPPLDQATVDMVTAAVVASYADPGAVVVEHIRKSAARNGRGYCGEITVEEGADKSVFHLVFNDTSNKPSVLVLSDYPDADASANAATVHRLMHNFGCVE